MLARARLSPAGQQQIALYLRMLEVTAASLMPCAGSWSALPGSCGAPGR